MNQLIIYNPRTNDVHTLYCGEYQVPVTYSSKHMLMIRFIRLFRSDPSAHHHHLVSLLDDGIGRNNKQNGTHAAQNSGSTNNIPSELSMKA